MELNAETVKKALDWLDSLVGNSNDSDIAMFTYQLLGILYDTCEELTEANERLKDTISLVEKNNDELARVLPLAKKEVEVETAREIFEELEKFLSPYRYPIIAELKKEYMEENENGKG